MTDAGTVARPFRRWALRFVVGLGLLSLILALLHTVPVRRAVLGQIVAILHDRFDIVLQADSLRYNLLALRVTLQGVQLAAAHAPDAPFVQVDEIDVAIPASALRGRFALDVVRLDNVRLSIVRRADGTTNLPASNRGADSGPPAEVRFRRLEIPRIAIDVVDAVRDLDVTIPGLAIDIGPADGTLRLLAPGQVRRAAVTTQLTGLGGGVAFDGRSVRLTGFALSTSEAAIAANGTMALLVPEPRVDLQFSGRGDVPGLARWGTRGAVPTGALAFDGAVSGSMAGPAVTARVRSDALTWDALTALDIRGDLAVDGERLRVSTLDATLAGGRITGTGEIPFGTGDTDLELSWSDLDIHALVRTLAPAAALRPTGRATGTASLRGKTADLARWTIDARTSIRAVPAARRQIGVGGAVRLQVANRQWRLEATSTLLGVPLEASLRGRLASPRLAVSSLGGTIALRDADLPRLVEALRTADLADLPGETIAAGTMDAGVMLAGTFERPRFRITAVARELIAQGFANLAAEVRAEGTPQQVAVEARLRQGGNAVGATGTVWPAARRLEARVTGRLRDLSALVPDLPIAGVVELQFEGGGPFDALEGRGTIAVAGARYRELPLGPLAATVAVDAAAVQAAIVSEELGARATARMTLDEARTATVDLQVDEADLGRLVRDIETPVPLTGRVSLTAHGAGSLNDWRKGAATLEISRLDARAGELPIRLATPARIAYRDTTIEVSSLEATVGETRWSIAGRLPASARAPAVADADALRAVMAGDLTHALEAIRATGLGDVPAMSGRGALALRARVTGSVERPAFSADFEMGPGLVTVAELPPVRALELRAHLEGGWLELRSAAGEWQQSRVTAEGRVLLRLLGPYLPAAVTAALPTPTGRASLAARAVSMTPRVLAPFLAADTLAQIEGSVDASVRLDTPSLNLEDLHGEVRIDQLDVRVAGLPVQQREPTRIAFDGGFARVAAWDWIGQGATLGVRGQIRLEDRQTAILADGRIDLRTLTPFVRGAGITTSGVLTPRISITGPLEDPRIDGDLTLAAGEIRLVEPRLIATDLSARVVLSGTHAQMTSLSGTVNGGTITGGGEFDYGRTAPFAARFDVSLMGMALEAPTGLRSELDADLSVAVANAPAGAGGRVSGTVTVLRSAYREPIAVVTGLLSALRTERLRAIATTEESLLDRLALDVRVVTDSDVVVDNNLARVQIGGDLRVIGTAAAPSVSGRATLREGGRLFLGRNTYTIESGTVTFTNPITIEPNLNVQARTRAGGESIELTLTGTPDDIDVDLRSVTTPELGQADLASLLLTGRRLDDVSGAERQIVGEQVIGYLSGDALGIASRVVGLDTIRLGGVDQPTLRRDPAAIAAQADPTSRITFGKSLGNAFEVTFSQSLRANDAQTWILDYRPVPQVDLRLVSRDDNLRSYEFQHDVSFGSAGAERRAAPDERPVMKVAAVSLTGDLGVSEATLRDLLRLEPGNAFDFSEWQRDRDRLELFLQRQAYREAQVSARRVESGPGVALEYQIQAGPRTAITVTGHALSGATVRALEQAWSQSVFDDFFKEEAGAIVRRVLAEDGYLQPEVRIAITDEGAKTLQIEIAPGERTVERGVAVEVAEDDALSRSLKRWIRDERLEDAAWREPGAVERALADRLRSQGHLNADVTVGAPRIDGRTAAVVFTVTTGPAFALQDVRFVDTGALDIGLLREAAALTAGTAYDPVAAEAARLRVTRLYRREGFGDARVTLEPSVDREARLVSLAFRVDAGPRQILREVSVQGNRAIHTDVITRALDLKIGDPLGAEAWLQARARLFDTALFRRVDVTAEPIEKAPLPDAEQPMRVKVAVQEWPAVRLRYGFQLSEERPEEEVEGSDLVPGFSSDVTRRTLFGRAITIGGAVEYQRRERLGRAFANAPTLFGLPIESLLTVQRAREEFADATLVTDRSGVSWEQRVRVTNRLSVSYSYRFERNHTFDTDEPPGSPFPAFDVSVNVGRLTSGAVYDSRDNPIDTARGSLLSSNVEFAPGALGSDIRFVRHLGQAYHFQPWRGVVLASAGRVGLAAALGGQTLIPSERFFGGGARSVRGVAQDGLGLRNVFEEPAGGNALVVLNQEVRFPVYRWVKGVGFADAGNVFETASAIDLRKLVGSAGVGLRVITPLALFRVDYARLWSPRPDDRPGRWTFGIGQAF